MKYICDYCDFKAKDKPEIVEHERACEISAKLNGIGIKLTVKNVETMVSRNLLNLDELNHVVVEDEAFGHPGRAQQRWICPDAGCCKVEKCVHKTPHNKTRGCGVITGVCPGCVEVKR